MSEPPAIEVLRRHTAAALRQDAVEIAQRWTERTGRVDHADPAENEAARVQGSVGAGFVRAVANALEPVPHEESEGIALGIAHGACAYAHGISLHQTLRSLGLLWALVLYRTETAVQSVDRSCGISPADAIRVCRRIERATGMIASAVAKGHVQGASDETRDHFRRLRHDLRNPLGTARSVLTMMDDQSIPLEARENPRFRVMAARNLRSMEELIADRLGDVQATSPLRMKERTSLREVTSIVRRDLREEAHARGVTVIVPQDTVPAALDAGALELVLHEALLAALAEAATGDEVRIDFDDTTHGQVALRMSRNLAPAIGDADTLQRLDALARRLGAHLDAVNDVRLVFPLESSNDRPTALVDQADSAPAPDSSLLDRRKASQDVGRAGERDHGQASTL